MALVVAIALVRLATSKTDVPPTGTCPLSKVGAPPAAVFVSGEPPVFDTIERLKLVFVDGVFDAAASDDPALAGEGMLSLGSALEAAREQVFDPGLRAGLNVFHGELTQPAVAAAFGLQCRPVETALRAA